jgi:hypothetical protein
LRLSSFLRGPAIPKSVIAQFFQATAWAASLLGFVALTMVPILFVFSVHGKE